MKKYHLSCTLAIATFMRFAHGKTPATAVQIRQPVLSESTIAKLVVQNKQLP